MQKIIFFTFLCLCVLGAFPQTLDKGILWSEFYGSGSQFQPYAMQPHNGGYAMLGQFFRGNGDLERPLVLIIVDQNGTEVNRLFMAYNGLQDYPLDFLVTMEGNFIIFGN